MYGLMYKDLLVNKKNLILCFIICLWVNVLQFMAGSDDTPVIFTTFINAAAIIMTFYIVGFFEGTLYELDERKKWAYFVTSCPDGVKLYVGSKYFFTYLFSTAAMIFCMLINVISIDFFHNSSNIVTLSIFLFMLQILLRSIDLPFTIAFGSKAGTNIRIILMVCIGFAILVYALFGDLSIFFTWEDVISFFTKTPSAKIIIIISIAEILIFPVYYLSYRISCRLYLKGGDNYEK